MIYLVASLLVIVNSVWLLLTLPGNWLMVATGRKMHRALRPSLAAGAGRLAGTLMKFAIGVVIWTMIAVAAFWP